MSFSDTVAPAAVAATAAATAAIDSASVAPAWLVETTDAAPRPADAGGGITGGGPGIGVRGPASPPYTPARWGSGTEDEDRGRNGSGETGCCSSFRIAASPPRTTIRLIMFSSCRTLPGQS